jgi:hypothetical protein
MSMKLKQPATSNQQPATSNQQPSFAKASEGKATMTINDKQ